MEQTYKFRVIVDCDINVNSDKSEKAAMTIGLSKIAKHLNNIPNVSRITNVNLMSYEAMDEMRQFKDGD